MAAAGSALGLDGTYIARSYIEQVREAQLWLDILTYMLLFMFWA